jgi:hypothetical protein
MRSASAGSTARRAQPAPAPPRLAFRRAASKRPSGGGSKEKALQDGSAWKGSGSWGQNGPETEVNAPISREFPPVAGRGLVHMVAAAR